MRNNAYKEKINKFLYEIMIAISILMAILSDCQAQAPYDVQAKHIDSFSYQVPQNRKLGKKMNLFWPIINASTRGLIKGAQQHYLWHLPERFIGNPYMDYQTAWKKHENAPLWKKTLLSTYKDIGHTLLHRS